jgi:hypothetical protein
MLNNIFLVLNSSDILCIEQKLPAKFKFSRNFYN